MRFSRTIGLPVSVLLSLCIAFTTFDLGPSDIEGGKKKKLFGVGNPANDVVWLAFLTGRVH